MQVQKLKPAKEIAAEMTKAVYEDLGLQDGDETAVIVSGLGAAPLMELYVLYDEVERYLKRKRASVFIRTLVGN